MRFPWANTVLLVLLIAQIGSGFGVLVSGSTDKAWVAWSHVAGAYAIAFVLLWKGRVIVRAIRRRPRWSVGRVAFLVLLALLLATLATGFLWSYTGPHNVGGFTLLTIHGFLAVATVLLLIWHVIARRVIFRVERARDRRALLRLGGISLMGILLWRADRPLQAAFDLPGAHRRFTGSFETGSYTGRFPRVIWLSDSVPTLDVTTWRLHIDGAVDRPLSLAWDDLAAFSVQEQDALIDCTGGWYSVQSWQGISLVDLLAAAGVQPSGRSVTVRSDTGYYRKFSLDEIDNFLLATHVAGERLDRGHGYPLRLVAPGKRGFEWVKWVTAIRINERSKYWQPPLPLQ